MRKHSVRKWLHAILDLLPLIILPIFAIYSHRHTIDSYEVTVPQNQVVDFNQLSVINDFEYNAEDEGSVITLNDSVEFQVDNVYLIQVSQSFTYSSVSRNVPILYSNFNLIPVSDYFNVVIGDLSISTIENVNLSSGSHYVYLKANSSFTAALLYWINDGDIDNNYYHVNFYNLTQMFGSGNEPSYVQFLRYYPLQDYAYTLSHKELLKNYSTITYDNSDIGSQMMYSLYKPINDYFNLNNVFNFGAIYDWFELNMFNGNAPLSIYIVWNIIVYEFIMDIIFLIYSVFMFIIDFACETLDRFTGWAKRGE